MNLNSAYMLGIPPTRTAERTELLVSLAKKTAAGIALATLVAAASARDTRPSTPASPQKPADTRQYAGAVSSTPAGTIHYRVR